MARPIVASAAKQSNGKAEWYREVIGRRAAGILLVLLVETALLLLLLTLNQPNDEERRTVVPISSFNISGDERETQSSEPAPDPDSAQESQEAASPEPAPQQPQARPDQTPAARVPSPLLPFTREQLEGADITNLPTRTATRPAANGQTMGPPAPPAGAAAGDSQRVAGSGPNGEPLYAATWYREPRPDELRGYLQTAREPGWGLIICQTVAEYRVENCEFVSEYPRGSQIGRAALAAAWQFRVRPPRIGGESQVGAWVRIRLDYDIRRQ